MTDSTAPLRPARAQSRLRLAATAAALGVVCGSFGLIMVSDEAGAIDTIYVSPAGDDAAAGDMASPVRTIEQAVRLAQPGDTVQIAGGTYHESIQVYSKEVHLQAAADEEVILDGARVIGGWSASNGRWVAPWSTRFERAGPPFTTAEVPQAGWPEQFFLDGAPLIEVRSFDALRPGAFFYDIDADQVVIADDPTGRLVEGSDLPWGIYLNEADGSSIDGLTVRRYATLNRNMAAIRAYADDLTITNVTVDLNARMGVSVIGDRITMTDVRAIDNGHLGIHGHRSTDVVLRDLVVSGNNRERFDAKHSAGGIKITNSARLVFDSLLVTDNDGPGIWTDLDVSDVLIRSSTVKRNGRSGIEIELSDDVIVFDNVVVDNGEAGIWVLESSDVDLWHNTMLGNVRDVWVLDGNRADLVGVNIVNNVLGDGAQGAPALLNVDDWTEQRSAAQMNVKASSNRYWLRPGSPTTLVSRWANWPLSLSLSSTIEDHRSATGQGAGSDLVSSPQNPFARSESDVRQPAGAPVGSPLSAPVAEATGAAGPFPAGAIVTTGEGDPPPTGSDDDGSTTTTSVPGGDGSTTTTSVPGDTGSSTTIAPNRIIPPPGSVPDGVENAQIGRSGQAAAGATPAELPSSDTDLMDCSAPTASPDVRQAGRHCAGADVAVAAAPTEEPADDVSPLPTTTTTTTTTVAPAPTTTPTERPAVAVTPPDVGSQLAAASPRSSGWGALRDYVERAVLQLTRLGDDGVGSNERPL